MKRETHKTKFRQSTHLQYKTFNLVSMLSRKLKMNIDRHYQQKSKKNRAKQEIIKTIVDELQKKSFCS